MDNKNGKRAWVWLIQNWCYIRLGIKTSIPPGILMCLIASDRWINHFQTSSYLAPVIAACALPTLPRALLLRHQVRLALAFALSYCYALLAGWSALKARQHTESSSASVSDYNASAPAVIGVYFVFYFWFVFTVKSAYTTWQLPAVLAGLYAAAVLPPLAKAASFSDILNSASTLIEACLVGLAVALAMGLLIFPRTCRHAFIEGIRSATQAASQLAQTHAELLLHVTTTQSSDVVTEQESVFVAKIQDSLRLFHTHVNRARTYMALAEQELAWSRVDNVGLNDIDKSISELVPLLAGVVSTVEMLHTARQTETSGISCVENDAAEKSQESGSKERQGVNSMSGVRHELFLHSKALAEENVRATKQISAAMNAILMAEKASWVTVNRRDSNTSTGFDSRPKPVHTGKGAAAGFQQSTLHPSALHANAMRKFPAARSMLKELSPEHRHINSVTYFIAINEQSLQAITLQKLQRLLDTLTQIPGKRKRMVVPYWITGGQLEDQASKRQRSRNTARFIDTISSTPSVLYQLFCTKHTRFGLRGACAMMSIGIIAFLPSSGIFYAEQRFLWALYAILLSLNETSGSSTQSLVFRFVGTLASMVASYVAWYVPDQKTPGILVFIWIWFAVLGYLYARFPRIQGSWFVALIAAIVMVGNELQVRKLGAAVVEAKSQAIYPPYVLFPYRMAVVTLGILVAYVWTLLPFPLTDHHELRRCLAASMLSLAKLHLVVGETAKARILGSSDRSSRCYSPQAAHEALRIHSSDSRRHGDIARALLKFLDWEIFGRRLISKDAATKILSITERLQNQMCLTESIAVSMTSSHEEHASKPGSELATTLLPHVWPKGISSRLLDLANALSEGHVLAPDLNDVLIPDIVDFLELECDATELFASATLAHAAHWYMIQDLSALTRLVGTVVGTLDYTIAA